VKALAIAMLVAGSTILFSNAPDWAKWCAGGLALTGVSVILFAVPTLHHDGVNW